MLAKNALTMALSLSFTLCTSVNVFANNISLDSMTKDITFLASNELNGRANFSEDIDKAANYISQRFQEIGLVPLESEQSFLQSFELINIAPEKLSAVINDLEIADKHITMASTIEHFNWTIPQDFSTHVIGKDDNMRAVISSLNQTGGKHLVLINTAHAKLFSSYRGYFARGLNKLKLEHQGAIVMVLTDEQQLESVNISATSKLTKHKLTNVVGVLPGKKKPKEIVLFSGHYDHLGITPASNKHDNADVIYNGADDDASGTTAVINLAQYYAKKENNARTLMFSAFTAEEIGGFGSRYFSQQLNPDDVVAMINIEMIGKPSKFGPGEMWMTGMERSNLGSLLNESLKDKGNKVHQDPYPEQQLFYRSDNATLARLGVPAHSFSSTQLDKDKHYHQVSDDLASLNLSSMLQVIESLSIATQGLVNGDITPTRVDVNQVKKRGKIY
ncbi:MULTISPECIES: M20/M25/M40 family metallo-hydrolase [Thalassotalea]|uniref:M20/M25/M40 family metallo-hydrolase n=1 Tax=Thalassotalea castellviae TaxID=3075612 RepID=A0ABU3A2W6_9GAMM|nr:M20/M25/M40 family metallo-hydrolase [Thalassotalea sp. W431]MDT0604508.1 M20/M25/M40 family metallo-hydrolase [Thalassotalea sp. W431]